MKTQITLIILILGLSLIAQSQVVVPFANAPTIDGIIDSNDPWGNTWILQEKTTEGSITHAMKSKFQIMHDDDNIYIVVNVTDNTPNNGAVIQNSYERDCIETYFSFNLSNPYGGQYTLGDHQIRCQRAAENGDFISGTNDYEYFVTSGAIQYGVLSNNQGYVIEMAFNIATLAGNDSYNGAIFKFDIGTSDNTTGEAGGRTQLTFWNSNTDQQWNNTSYFGSMVLGENTKQNFPVTFTVKDENASPIEGVSVLLTGYGSKKTDNSGKVTFSKVYEADNIAYTATKTGFKGSTGTISVTNAIVNQNITINSLKAFPVTFTVNDENLIPIEGVTIELTDYNSQLTDSSGNAKFAEVYAVGDITYSASKTGFKTSTGTISVIDTAVNQKIELTAFKTYPVVFTITNDSLIPIEGAIVELKGYDSKLTDINGNATFSDVYAVGDIAYTVRKPSFKDQSGIVSVMDSAVYKNLIISLERPVKLIVPSAFAPKIDGIIDGNDPWGDVWVLQAETTENSVTQAMKSKFQIVHDGEYIYLVANVLDNTPNNDETAIPNTYERDCIETYFSFKSSNLDEGVYYLGDHQIRCQRASENGNFISGTEFVEDLVATGAIQYGVVSNNTGYVIEMAYAIEALVGESDFDGTNFRFELGTSDNTTGAAGGRTQLTFWNSNTDQQWNNTTYFGNLAFDKRLDIETLNAKFRADKTTGYAPLTVYFTDESTGVPVAWSWDFNNDGIEDANTQNPSFTFDEVGKYTVALTVTDIETNKSITKPDYITTTLPPLPSFTVRRANAPKIDGVIDDNDPWQPIWISQDLDYGWVSSYDMTSEYQIVHDDDYIYIAVHVQDSTIFTDSTANSYRDYVETWFSFKSSNFEDGAFTDGDHLIRCQRFSNNGMFIDGMRVVNGNWWYSYDDFIATGAIQYGVVSNNMGYVIEMAFNMVALASESNFNGESFRFEIITADNEVDESGYKTQRRSWYSDMETAWTGTWNLGNMFLQGYVEDGYVEDGTFVKNENNMASLHIYPNPVSQILTLSSPQNIESLVIINLQGQVVYRFNGKLTKNKEHQINVSELPSGLYLIKADSNTERFIVE